MRLRRKEKVKCEPHGIDLALMAAGAVLTGLTLVFPSIGFLEWVTMIPLLWGAYRIASDEHLGLGRAYGYGFLTVLTYYIVIYHWFIDLYPLDFVGLDSASSIVVVVAGWLGLSLLQAIPGGLIFLFFRLLHRWGLFERLPLLRPFVFSALWVIFEWSSTLSWTGVPWGRLCLGQIEMLPMLQSASLLGSYFVSFLILAVNGLLAYAILYRPRWILCVSVSAALVVCNLTYGLIARGVTDVEGGDLPVAVIQGNINSHEKWSSNSLAKTKHAYANLTRAAAAEGAKLVVWPETVLPYDLHYRLDLQSFLSDLAEECEITLIVGAYHQAGESEEYNALFLITPDGAMQEGYYAKRHLVPFGEYVPMQDFIRTFLPPLAELSELGGDLTAGENSALFETEYGRIGSLICFDSIYEQLTLASVRDGANIMVVSSNDSWFYDSAAVYQHQAQSQLRAIECGRYVVRSANTGISTVIAPDGTILEWIDPLESGYAVTSIRAIDTPTVYTVLGNLFVYLCIALVLTSGTLAVVWKRRGRKGKE